MTNETLLAHLRHIQDELGNVAVARQDFTSEHNLYSAKRLLDELCRKLEEKAA